MDDSQVTVEKVGSGNGQPLNIRATLWRRKRKRKKATKGLDTLNLTLI